MARRTRLHLFVVAALVALAFPAAALADHATRPSTTNLHALGHSPHTGATGLPGRC